MEENFSMELNMEKYFSMEWKMEWKIFGMEWKWKKIAGMEYGKIVFHSIPYHALAISTDLQYAFVMSQNCEMQDCQWYRVKWIKSYFRE